MRIPRPLLPLPVLLLCALPAAAMGPRPLPAPADCSEPASSGIVRPPVVGTPWRLEDLDRKGIIDRSRITLEFAADGRVSGQAGCNRYNGRYTLEGTRLAIDERVASTRMACVTEALMAQEQRFFELLPTMENARVDKTGALILDGRDGATMTFRFDEDAAREGGPAEHP